MDSARIGARISAFDEREGSGFRVQGVMFRVQGMTDIARRMGAQSSISDMLEI